VSVVRTVPAEEYRLTTAEIVYRLPDNPEKLQTFIWQTMDTAPDYPRMSRFIQFWRDNIDGELYSVRVGQASPQRHTVPYVTPASNTRH
jgi:uncharacterized protein Usg